MYFSVLEENESDRKNLVELLWWVYFYVNILDK